MELDRPVLPKKVVVGRHDQEDPPDELDDEVAIAFPGVQDAVAVGETTYREVAFLGATS